MNLPHKKIGVGVIINEQGEILIDQRLSTGLMANLWEFPGGKIEQGETPQDCIKREIKEELGITIEVDRALTEITHNYSEFIVTLYVYICRIIEGEPQPLECAQVKWVKPPELDKFEFPKANQEIIELLQKKSSI
jgi:mutator protein MutT